MATYLVVPMNLLVQYRGIAYLLLSIYFVLGITTIVDTSEEKILKRFSLHVTELDPIWPTAMQDVGLKP